VITQVTACAALLPISLGVPLEGFYLCIFLWGLSAGVAMTMSRTIMQEQAPATHQSRIMAALTLMTTGGGPIGQLILRVLKAFGAYSITLSDVSNYAREFALSSGATQVVNPMQPAEMHQLESMYIVWEDSGNPSALNDGIRALKRGGTLVLVGTMPETFSITGNAIMSKQLNILGSFRFAHVFEEAIRMVAAGIIQLDGLITDTFPFEESPQALQEALTRHERMKIQIVS
jgi:L-iditol 2-dehydrogenase